MSISPDAMADTTADRVPRHRTLLFTLRHTTLTRSVPSLSGADWTFTQLICLMGGPRAGTARNIGRRYCLHGAGYTTVQTIQLLFH